MAVICTLVVVAAAAAQDAGHDPAEKRITGRVLDSDGEPIAGAAVGVFAESDFVDTVKLLAQPPLTTAADGTFAVAPGSELQWGSVVIAANGRQSCAMPITEALLRNGGAFDDVLLPPGAKLIGRVRDAGGAPLSGVQIRIDSPFADAPQHTRAGLLAGAVSDANGIFQVVGVPRTGLRLVAAKTGYLTQARLVSQQTPADLTLAAAGVVRGKVVDAAGAPVAGVAVSGVTVGARDWTERAVTAADGAFVLTVPARGRFRLAGHEGRPPHRQFSSGLLHGAAAGVVLTDWLATVAPTVEVVVVDRETRAPIAGFGLSQQELDAGELQFAWKQHRDRRREYAGSARVQIRRRPGQPACLVVDAPGHGFAVVPVPDRVDAPLQVELGPEAVLTGRVLDAVSGEPLPGVAVAARPMGVGAGYGGRAVDAGPLTDAQGNYRIAGLRPGEYSVQAHAADREASQRACVVLEPGKEAHLDLTVPRPLLLRFKLTGRFPDHPGARIFTGGREFTGGFVPGAFEHEVEARVRGPLQRTGEFELGPVNRGSTALELFLPSRTRIGTGATIRIGRVVAGAAPVALALPEAPMRLVRGRVLLPQAVASERIGVAVAELHGKAEVLPQANCDGIDSEGRFELDLPDGSYCLQLIDLTTGIAFHTEADDLVVDGGTKPVTIRPEVHWLEIECAPARAGADVVLSQFAVDVPRPRNGAAAAFLQPCYIFNGADQGSVPFPAGAATQRWLVPRAQIAIRAWQSFDALQPLAAGHSQREIGSFTVKVDGPEQKVVFQVPAPPSDEELLRRDD